MANYTTFYGFSEDPFDITPDPRFFFPSEGHNEALASLLYGITRKKGFVVVLGEAGIGKTTLIHHLLSRLDEKVTTLFFPRSDLPFQQILKEMLLQLHLPLGLETKGSMIHELYRHLIRCLERDETVTVIFDEAENIGIDVIEEVRLLANLETSTSKLLQIVLVGEQGLMDKLRSEVIRQIKQRVVISCRIHPLSEEESMQYIDHRMKIAGSGSSEVFSDEALSLICRYAKGIPFAINILCHNALSMGYSLSEKKVTPAMVRKIRNEKEPLSLERARILPSGLKRSLTYKIAYIVPALVIFVIAFFWGRGYWQPLFDAQQPHPSVTSSINEDKVKDSVPEIRHEIAADNSPGSPHPGSISSTPEAPTPHIPSPPPATIIHSGTEIRAKEIIEVKEGATLYSIAYQYHKIADETFIDHILKLNPEIKNPNLILIGQKIKIPEITESLMIVIAPDGQYKVHLRTFRNLKTAEQYREKVASIGKKIEVVPWKVTPEETWYRVMTEPFTAKDDASKFIEETKR